MSCNYYRVMPEPPRPEVFGFKKVSQEELGNIISRLSRPTYNSRVHTVEAHKAHNYRKIHSAPPPRTPTQCARRRLSTPNPNSIIAAMTTTNNLKNNFSSTPSPNPITENPNADPTGATTEPTSDAVDAAHDADNSNNDNNTKVTNNEDNDNTVIEKDEEEEDDDDEEEPTSPSPLLPSPPPPPPVPLSERRMTELELRRFLRRIQRPTRAHVRSRRDYVPEEDKEIMAGDDFSTFNADRNRRPLTATERKKAFFLMSRPTTASKAKSSVDCVFCPADEEERKANRNLDLPFKYPHAPEVKIVSSGEASSIVSRVSSPTRASLRGAGPPCHRATPDYDAVRCQQTSLPLVSGLARTSKVSQIVNRLHYGSPKRITIIVREEEDSVEESEETSVDRRGSRGTSSEDERGRFHRGAPSSRHQQQRRHNSQRQIQNGHRSYHGYHTAATPVTAWA